MTHRSALNEKISQAPESNERLEFLGDAVLELATTLFLYYKLPQKPEGQMTVLRSSLVKTTSLAEVGRELGLMDRLLMSRGEERSGGRQNETLLANTVEALIGGLYLDQGFEVVQKFLNEALFPKFDQIYEAGTWRDDKSLLQEVVQAETGLTPLYQVLDESGPDHYKTFKVAVLIEGEEVAIGIGHSKQSAQQEAAKKARCRLDEEPELWARIRQLNLQQNSEEELENVNNTDKKTDETDVKTNS